MTLNPKSDSGKSRFAHALGLLTTSCDSVELDAYFPSPSLGEVPKHLASLNSGEFVPSLREAEAGFGPGLETSPRNQARQLIGLRLKVIEGFIDLEAPPQNSTDAYLRLHLLSHCLVKPNCLNLEGIFEILPNLAFTNYGAMTLKQYEENLPKLKQLGVVIQSMDKFPPMLNYVIPKRVRIADALRVRLGAHLAPGTTVMHEGFVNFNAGSLGQSMIEGRISQGVVIDSGTDIGGGASVMGTLSGGGKEKITIGRNTLIGANAGVGISLGDNCTIEAGLYLTAGAKIVRPGADRDQIIKAKELGGRDNLLFRRNSLNGQIEALEKTESIPGLNSSLHL